MRVTFLSLLLAVTDCAARQTTTVPRRNHGIANGVFPPLKLTAGPCQSQTLHPSSLDAVMVRGGGANFEDQEVDIGPSRVPDVKATLGFLAEAALELALLVGGARTVGKLQQRWSLDDRQSMFLDGAYWTFVAFAADMLTTGLRWGLSKLGLVKAKPAIKVDGWYEHIRKPKWTPPNAAFPIIWIPLKAMQVVGSWLLWKRVGRDPLATPILLFLGHIVLGDMWNEVFFRERYIGAGLSVISLFYITLLATTFSFKQLDQQAALLLLPTCIWVTIATKLNLSIWRLNGEEPRYPFERSGAPDPWQRDVQLEVTGGKPWK